eukprot:gene4624-5775_t
MFAHLNISLIKFFYDPQGEQDDPQGEQDDPQGEQDDPQGEQDDPQDEQDDPQDVQDDPQDEQDDPQGEQDDPHDQDDLQNDEDFEEGESSHNDSETDMENQAVNKSQPYDDILCSSRNKYTVEEVNNYVQTRNKQDKNYKQTNVNKIRTVLEEQHEVRGNIVKNSAAMVQVNKELVAEEKRRNDILEKYLKIIVQQDLELKNMINKIFDQK